MKKYIDKIFNDDCLNVLRKLPDESVDLIITSPPYAFNRKKTYGGIPVKNYCNWFLPISLELKRVLKNNGSFILNIKERVVNGERGTYVIELILQMRQQGWLWTEEYLWHKKNCFPGKWPNRFRDSWERCLHFTKHKQFNMYQDQVMVPIGNWSEKRLNNLSHNDMRRDKSRSLSGFSKNISNWVGKKMIYPTNVLHMATECKNRYHSAAFPLILPSWFIRLFTKENDIIIDPFVGSGTTVIACMQLNRHYIGVELLRDYYELCVSNINKFKKSTPNQRFIMLEKLTTFTEYTK